MAHFSRSPAVLGGGFVLLQPPAWQILQVVVFQYNPESLRHRIAVIAVPEQPADARLLGSTSSWWSPGWVGELLGSMTSWWPSGSTGNAPAARERTEVRERIEMELVFDAADDLEYPDAHAETARLGLLPRLDALRAVAFPTSSSGASPVLLLLFGARQALPVRVSTLAIDEEAFGPTLCPLRARARLELEVLSPRELPAAGPPNLAVQEALRSITAASGSA
jgi:hypothetical protein